MRRFVGDFVTALLVACAAVAVTLPGLHDRGFTLVWPGAIGVGFLVTRTRDRWPIYVLVYVVATILANRHAGFSPEISFVRGVSDTVIIAVLAWAMRRWIPQTAVSTSQVWAFLALAMATALARAGLSLLLWTIWRPPFLPTLGIPTLGLGLSTLIGVLVLVPFVILVQHREEWTRGALGLRIRGVAWLAVSVLVVAFAFYGPTGDHYLGLSFLVVPLVVMFATVPTPLLLGLELVIVSLGASMATSLHFGPFLAASGGDLRVAAFSTQALLVSLPVAAWLLAGAVASSRADRQELEQRLEESTGLMFRLSDTESKLRAALNNAAIPTAFGPTDGSMGEGNAALAEFYGMSLEELQQRHWLDFNDAEDAEEDLRLSGLLRAGEIDEYRIIKRYRLPNGVVKWGDLSVTSVPLPSEGQRWAIAQIVDVTAEVEARVALQRLVDTDSVTGLPSVTWMTSALQEVIISAREDGATVAVMLVDLSEFLVVNRTFGFEAGNEVLRALAETVRATLPDECLLGRFEGNALLVVHPNAGSSEDIRRLAGRVLEAVEQETVAFGRRISRSASIGIALASRVSTSISLMRDADQALLRAKAAGRSRFHLLGHAYTEGEALAPLELEHELRNALDAQQFIVYYQPQVRLADGGVCGHEALVRWQHPERGVLSPAAFIPIMESSALVVPLGRLVLRTVCARIRADVAHTTPISVNVSAVEIAAPTWFDDAIAIIEESGVDPRMLVFEITESTVLEMSQSALERLAELRAMGIGIHVDDFGVGFTSIGNLQQLPVTALKLDQTFTAALEDGRAESVALVRSIAALADGLGLETIAEGIETEAQAATLRSAGWRLGQGYLFGRPAPLS